MDKDKLADKLLEKFLKQGLGFPRFRGDVWETIADYILENFVAKEPQTKEVCEHEWVSLYGGDWNCLKCNATSWKTPEDYKPKPKPKLPDKMDYEWINNHHAIVDKINAIIDFLGGGG